ncbi:Mth938-like domain-containing protein [Chthonobacter rhizosphaerae]|uniref:Mth938-like domain-containing protein n=1 Tax=Chthonobacter rhizosphaerae TaxID=2735553 RepID=UPI0015EF1AAC|nr:MTH938/NDUFAF3 family protein [Chthonobacter rhizosphaerae]
MAGKLFEPRGAHGIVMREQHFPGRAPISAYGNGGFRFADMSHRGSILCLPSGIHGWSVSEASEIGVETLRKALDEAADFEVLLIGSGRSIVPMAESLRFAMRERGLRGDVMPTGAAVRTYNIMLGENRAVAAALLAVE